MAKFTYHGVVGIHVPICGAHAGTIAALFRTDSPSGARPNKYLLVTLDELKMAESMPDLRKRVYRGQRIPMVALLAAEADLVLAKIDVENGVEREFEGFPFSHLPIVSSLNTDHQAPYLNNRLEELAQAEADSIARNKAEAQAVRQSQSVEDDENDLLFDFAAAIKADVVYADKSTTEVVALFQTTDPQTGKVKCQAIMTRDMMLQIIPQIEDREKGGEICEISSLVMHKALKETTRTQLRTIKIPSLLEALPRWPMPVEHDANMSL